MQNEFSVLAPEQEKELKDTFIVMMNMQIKSKSHAYVLYISYLIDLLFLAKSLILNKV